MADSPKFGFFFLSYDILEEKASIFFAAAGRYPQNAGFSFRETGIFYGKITSI